MVIDRDLSDQIHECVASAHQEMRVYCLAHLEFMRCAASAHLKVHTPGATGYGFVGSRSVYEFVPARRSFVTTP